MNENEKRLWWQAYLAALAGSYACPDLDDLPASASSDAIRAANMAVEDYREHCGNNSSASDPAWTGHARVELMGHRSYLGRIREVERYGARLGEVQELLPSGEYGATHQFGGKGVYEIQHVALEDALKGLRGDRCRHCAGKHCYAHVLVQWGHPAWEDSEVSVLCGECKAEGKAESNGEGKADADLPFDEVSSPQECPTKLVKCIDCGVEFLIDSQDCRWDDDEPICERCGLMQGVLVKCESCKALEYHERATDKGWTHTEDDCDLCLKCSESMLADEHAAMEAAP